MARLQILDPRLPAWLEAEFEPRVCPFCGKNTEPHYERPDGLKVAHCSDCDCHYVSPAPSEAHLAKFYNTYFNEHSRAGAAGTTSVRAVQDLNPTDDFRVIEWQSMLRADQRQVLDIGCGKGELLVMLNKAGFETVGVDYDEDAVHFAREKLGLTVYKGDTDRFDDRTFDLVTLNDVIEHPLQPMHMLKNALRVLRHGGLLSLYTPNGGAIAPGFENVCLRVDLEHMQYLSSQTCEFIASVLNLRVVHLETLGYPSLLYFGSSQPATRMTAIKRIRANLKFMPGFQQLNRWRKRLLTSDPRKGNYHLFAVFQKR